MRKFQLLILILSCLISAVTISPVLSQPFQIGHISLEMVDSSRNNRQIPAEVYYPALTAGEEVPVASGQFPILSFGHGFVMTVDAYTNFSDALVPGGYILVLANTETNFSPSHSEFALDLSFIIHAMALANTDPSAISASTSISAPALLFSGSEDCVAPPSQHQEIMFDSLASSCKTLISITGGGHCYFANDNFLCTFGENSCGPNLNITREEQQEVTFSFLSLWLDCFLKDNQASWEIFLDSLTFSQRITYEQECDLTRLPEKGTGQLELKVFPVPFKDYITVEGDVSVRLMKVYDLTGREVFSKALTHDLPAVFALGFLNRGIYQLMFTGENGEVITRKAFKF